MVQIIFPWRAPRYRREKAGGRFHEEPQKSLDLYKGKKKNYWLWGLDEVDCNYAYYFRRLSLTIIGIERFYWEMQLILWSLSMAKVWTVVLKTSEFWQLSWMPKGSHQHPRSVTIMIDVCPMPYNAIQTPDVRIWSPLVILPWSISSCCIFLHGNRPPIFMILASKCDIL